MTLNKIKWKKKIQVVNSNTFFFRRAQTNFKLLIKKKKHLERTKKKKKKPEPFIFIFEKKETWTLLQNDLI